MKINRNNWFVKYVYMFKSVEETAVPGKTEEITYCGYGHDGSHVSWVEQRQAYIHTNIPFQTSLCRLFWRSVLMCSLATGAAAGVAGLLYFASLHWKLSLTSVVIGLTTWGVAGLLQRNSVQARKVFNSIEGKIDAGVEGFVDRVDAVIDSAPVQIFWKGAKALKQQLCPIVRLED